MILPFWDPTFTFLIPAMLLAGYAQWKVQSTFAEFSKHRSHKGTLASEVVNEILQAEGATAVKIEATPGQLSDNYDPRDKTLRLSEPVFHSDSISAIAVAAHEAGHAIQDANAYGPLKFRQTIVPVSNFGSMLAFPLFFFGLFLGAPFLMDIGILFFSGAVAFTLLTLPVEYKASARALTLLEKGNFLTSEELPMARKVLMAAALTYVAAMAVALMNLLRLLALRGMSRNR